MKMFATFFDFVKIEQLLFSLPWAGSLLLLEWKGESLRSLLALVGVVLVRNLGMILNRWIDRSIDARNPRTASRPLASGKIGLAPVICWILLHLLALFLLCSFLGPIFLWFFPFVVALLLLYSFSKRFTSASHFILGFLHASSLLLISLLLEGKIVLSSILLAISAGSSVIAGDLVYSLQDRLHDKKVGLYSIPALFGTLRTGQLCALFCSISVVSFGFCGYARFAWSPFFWVPWLAFAATPFSLWKRSREIYPSFFSYTSRMPLLAFLALAIGKGFSK